MKIIIFIFFLTALVTSGCSNLINKLPQDSKPSKNIIEVSDKNNDTGYSEEFLVLVKGKTIALQDWDDKINLSDLLGEPISEKIEKLGPGSDTFQGSFVKELNYQGLNLKLFSPKENGKTFYIISMKITNNIYLTPRGIKVGEKVEELRNAYPELSMVLDGRSDPSNCAYQYQSANNYLVFEVTGGIVEEIKVYFEAP